MLPSQLPTDIDGPVACDVESSGLFADDGARISAIAVAWRSHGQPGDPDGVAAHAYPFDQGTLDKLDQPTLFAETERGRNLPRTEWDALYDWLQQQDLINHNIKYDLHMLAAGTRHWPGQDLESRVVGDTMLAAHLLWPTQPAGLKPTAERLELLGGDERDDEKKLKAHLKSVTPSGYGTRYDFADIDTMLPYARRDVELTLLLHEYQQEEIANGGLHPAHLRREVEFMRVLYRMEKRGVRFDVDQCRQAAAVVRERMDQIEQRLPFRATLPAAKDYFFNIKQVPIVAATPTGKPKLDDEVMHRLEQDGVEWVADYYEYTRLQKALSMWYKGWADAVGPDGRLRCSFKQTKVKSGRLSVERVQLQAIPKGDKTIDGIPPVKPMFLAREGHLLWNLDLSQAELRVAARYADCTRMIEMLEGGADIHGVTTKEIFGITEDHPEWRYKRDIAKRLTFGGIFQIGARTFQATLSKLARIDLPLAECEATVKRWRGLYPEFSHSYYRYMNQVERHGWVELVGKERSWFTAGRDYPNTGWNRRVQASLAKGAKLWLMDIERQVPGALLLTVHDSAVLELPEETGAETVAQLQQSGSDLLTDMFEIRMSIDAALWENAQGERWTALQGRIA